MSRKVVRRDGCALAFAYWKIPANIEIGTKAGNEDGLVIKTVFEEIRTETTHANSCCKEFSLSFACDEFRNDDVV